MDWYFGMIIEKVAGGDSVEWRRSCEGSGARVLLSLCTRLSQIMELSRVLKVGAELDLRRFVDIIPLTLFWHPWAQE